MDPLISLPIAEISPDALIRDRTGLDPDAMRALKHSIATEGLRMPIEVWAFHDPRPPHVYGLISGLRRLTACSEMGHTTIAAFVRQPASIPAAMAAMVSENEMRTAITPWEKGNLIMTSVEKQCFETPDAAIEALYPCLSRQASLRLRAFAMVVEALDGTLSTPQALTVARMERLAAGVRGGMEEEMHAVLANCKNWDLERQWTALQPLFAERLLRNEEPLVASNGRPRRFLHLKQGLTIKREACPGGWILRFTGEQAKAGGIVDDVLDHVEHWFQPAG